jgi:hypothetical protein
MNRLLLILGIIATVGSVLAFQPAGAQVLPELKKAERVAITKGPDLEIASDYLTIITWTTNNPGGSDVHYGIVRYGLDPDNLSQMARSPDQAEPFQPIHKVPRAHGGSQAADHLLLRCDVGGKRRQERWSEEPREEIYNPCTR